jgi:hypothetical protein
VPLNDLEVRVLQLSGKGSVAPAMSSSKQLENFLAEDSDSEPLENVKNRSTMNSKVKKSSSASRMSTGTEERSTPLLFYVNLKIIDLIIIQ